MVTYPHRIRLRGRWEGEPVPDRPGRVRYRRRFGYPGRIDDYERVWLTFTGVGGRPSIYLNGQFLGTPNEPSCEFDVTPLLSARNEVMIEREGDPDGEVAMEVRRTAFLREVQFAVRDGRLHVRGEIAGTAERALELYVVLGRSNVAYGTAAAGTRFELMSEPLTVHGTHAIRLDLVDGATVWYTLEQSFDIPPP